MPCFGLDLDLAHVAAIGEGRLRRGVIPGLGKARLDPWRLLRRVEGGSRHLLDTETAIRSGHREDAVGKLDIRLGRLKEMRGDAPSLGDQLVGRLNEGRTADRERARAAGAAAEGDRRGVALQHANLVGRDTELLDGELGIGCLMALPR